MRTINTETTTPGMRGSTSDVPPDPTTESIVEGLHQMIGSLRCAGTGRMVKAGISMTHLHILWVLEHHGDLPMSRLADLLDVSLSNASGLIDRMEERGLIERVRVPDDRRVVVVKASAEGARIREEIEALKQDRMRLILGRLKPDQRTRLLAAITDLHGAVVDEIRTDHLDAHVHRA